VYSGGGSADKFDDGTLGIFSKFIPQWFNNYEIQEEPEWACANGLLGASARDALAVLAEAFPKKEFNVATALPAIAKMSARD